MADAADAGAGVKWWDMAAVKGKDAKGKKKRGGVLDALWGPLGLLLIFVVMAVSAAAITMMYDSFTALQENQ